MAAYVIADVDVTDPTGFAEYRALVPATLEPYGGRFLIRGGAHDVAEGDWRPARVEFSTPLTRLCCLKWTGCLFPKTAARKRWPRSKNLRPPPPP